MTDKELLEMAAKAEGRNIKYMRVIDGNGNQIGEDFIPCWNPLVDDGDALMLAVKLGIDITVSGKIAAATGYINGQCFQEYANGDLQSATRRAIVRAAAEIGKSMP